MKKGTASNSFSKGLVMDLNPLITPNNILTDALNATIITNNGNEQVLQNDMGNGRVETAFLPEGYIPVGSCEFGDIIYIASYNPFLDKCQLGCFPSPQRNISSTQTSQLEQSINKDDFQKQSSYLDQDGNEITEPNGELKQSSLKKIIYENNLTSGDKYIICAKNIENEIYLSDVGNTDHIKGAFPKLYKIKIVSIEDNGKIVELSSGLKWYTKNQKDYFLQDANIDKGSDNVDIDEWRSAVSSAYSIFSSKVSGKLALMIELESITGFSCTWGIDNIYKEIDTTEKLEGETIEEKWKNCKNGILYQYYPIYLSLNWETENNNINPSGILLYYNEWNGNGINILNQENEYETKSPVIYYENKSNELVEVNLNKIYWNDSVKNDKAWNSEIIRLYRPEKFCYDHRDDSDKGYKLFRDKKCYEKQLEKLNLGDIKNAKINHAEEFDKYYINAKYNEKTDTYCSIYDENKEVNPISLSDDIVNNECKYSIKKKFLTFKLPIEQKLTINGKRYENNELLNTENSLYKYEIAPYMPYGVLEAYKQEGEIDFSKIGKEDIALTTFKYYNQSGYSTFTWGMKGYCEPNCKISRVVFEFYDNQGKAAALHVNNKDSYNGIFTNYISFGSRSTYGLTDKGYSEDDDKIYHIGLPLGESDLTIGTEYLDKGGGHHIVDSDFEYEPTTEYYQNDGGILYANWLYLVKINIEYVRIGPLDKEKFIKTIVDYRWFWTTTQFNDQYFEIADFDNCNFVLNLDANLNINQLTKWTDSWKQNTVQPDLSSFVEKSYKDEVIDKDGNKIKTLLTLSAIEQLENPQTGTDENGNPIYDPNLRITSDCGLQNDYGVFNLNKDTLGEIKTEIYLGKYDIINVPEQPSIIYSDYAPDEYEHNIMPYSIKDQENSNNISSDIQQISNNISTMSVNRQGPGPGVYQDSMMQSPIDGKFNGWQGGGKAGSSNSPGYGYNKENSSDNNEENKNEENKNEEKLFGYDDFVNEFWLKFKDKSTSKKINYIDSNYELITENCDYIDTNAEDLLPEKGIDLIFFGKHYSKYFFTNKIDDIKVINFNSLLKDGNDLSYYNLYYNEELNSHCCQRALGLGIHNRDGKSSVARIAILNTITGGYDSTLSDTTYVVPSGDINISIHTALSKESDFLNKMSNLVQLKFLFPVVFGHFNGDSYQQRAYYNETKEGQVIGLNYYFKDFPKITEASSKTNQPEYHCSNWTGYLGCMTQDAQNIVFSDPSQTSDLYYINDNTGYPSCEFEDMAPIKYGRMLYSFLLQCFYLESESIKKGFKVDNYVYLSDNYTDYTKDIILKLEASKDLNNESDDNITLNDLIGFNGCKFSSFVETILESSKLQKKAKDLCESKPIINLQIGSCQKTFPIRFRFNYIKPKIVYDDTYLINFEGNELDKKFDIDIISEIKKCLKTSQIQFDKNKIYCFKYEKDGGTISSLSDSTQVYDLYDPSKYIDINNDFTSRLQLADGKVILPLYYSGSSTYKVKLRWEGEADFLTDFEKGIYFIKKSS